MRVPGKISRFLEKWGHYLLAALCAAVILLSGLWTRALSTRDAEALHDTAQRLADVTVPPAAFIPLRPCAGTVLRPFSTAPLFFPAVGVWQIHPGVDFAADEGEEIFAVGDGAVAAVAPFLRIDHGNGYVSEYRGLRETPLRPGQAVRAGQAVGTAGAAVPYEGAGHVCVRLTKQEEAVGFGDNWLTNPP